jgi:hypothetical protein
LPRKTLKPRKNAEAKEFSECAEHTGTKFNFDERH